MLTLQKKNRKEDKKKSKKAKKDEKRKKENNIAITGLSEQDKHCFMSKKVHSGRYTYQLSN